MKKTKADISLDDALNNDFMESDPFPVPMVVQETKVPATIDEDKTVVRNDLFDVKTKLKSVFDFLVNNVEEQMKAPGIIKMSPVSDIIELAKGIVFVDQKILANNKADEEPKTTEKPTNQTNTQNNFYGDDITAEMLDKMIKKHSQNNISGSEGISVPLNK